MEQKDIYELYLMDKIRKYENQMRGISYNLAQHKEILKRIQQSTNRYTVKPKQMELFGA